VSGTTRDEKHERTVVRPVNVLELRSVRGTGGGPEKTILLGAARADTSRVNVVVCYIRDVRDDVFGLDVRAKELGVNYVEVREKHSLDPGVFPKLATLIADRKIDLVHAHEYKTDLLAWLLARRTGVVPLATAHGWTGQSPREKYLYYPMDKWILSRLPRVVAVSSDIRDEIIGYGAKPDRVTVILNSIEPAAFRRLPERREPVRAALGIATDEIIVGTVGRVERQKRFDLLIDAMAPIFVRHPKVRLVVVGAGSLLESVKAQAATLGVADRCIFTGHRGDIADLHHAFDLFVQSSEYEGTPNAVIEAMAMETPLVATDVGGTSELAFDNLHGLLVPGRDVPALEGAIERALNDPVGCRTRALAARQRIESDLSFAARTRRLEDIYTEMVCA
jgi:glycosyltransferase involved in cell wall biosynthesis